MDISKELNEKFATWKYKGCSSGNTVKPQSTQMLTVLTQKLGQYLQYNSYHMPSSEPVVIMRTKCPRGE